MNTALFISEDLLKEYSPLSGNLDFDYLKPHIVTAQDYHIQPVLGMSLYTHLNNAIYNDTLTSEEAILVNDYIAKALVHYSIYDAIAFLVVKMENSSIVTKSISDSSAISFDDAVKLEERTKSKAEFYKQRLIDFLNTNSNQYPKYLEASTLPKTNSTDNFGYCFDEEDSEPYGLGYNGITYLTKVWHDATLTGDGTESSPLSVVGGSGGEITVDNAAPYSDIVIYDTIGTVVSFYNPLSLDPQFQVPQLYQLASPLSVAGTDPEESHYDVLANTGNWQFMGQTIEVVNDNTSKVHIWGGAVSAKLRNITGYKHGDTIVWSDYNSVLEFDEFAEYGTTHDPENHKYLYIVIPNDWTNAIGGWVEIASTDRQRKFYSDASDIRANARNYPENGDVVDLSTNNILRMTTTGAPFTDNGTTVIIPEYPLFGLPCAFVKVGEIGGGGGGGGHIIADSDEQFPQQPVLKFTGAVNVTNGVGETIVEVTAQPITVDAVPTDGSNNPVASNGVFDALALKVDKNTAIIGATKTKVTYDAKGLVTGGEDATTADIADSSNKRYVTDNQLSKILVDHQGYALSDPWSYITVGSKLIETVTTAYTLTDVRASLGVASSGTLLFTINIKKNGTSIFTTKLTFDHSETTTVTATTPYVFTATTIDFAVGDILEILVDQVGMVSAGKGLILFLTINK